MRKLIFSLSFICLTAFLFAQQKSEVKGKVTDKNGYSIPSVSILIKGTSIGIISDFEGNYSLQTSPNDTLVFSFIGYVNQMVSVNGRTDINVTLDEDITGLEEVVVVGYGSMKTKDLTSAITIVKSDEISSTPSGQAMQSLQGKVAGLQVVSSGAPGSAPKVRIRGIGSYPGVGNENPLYVVDGVFFDDIGFLNSNDIESISVLKDASAAAIYGVRAAKGVILIQTKSGEQGKTKITYDGYFGVQRAQNLLEMANTEQYVTMVDEANSFAEQRYIQTAIERYGADPNNAELPNVDTDWYKEVLRIAPMQNHSLNIAGGKSNATYSLGVNYFEQEGILNMPNGYDRFNLRSKVDFHATDWLKVGANVVTSDMHKTNEQNSAWGEAYYAVPILPVYDGGYEGAFPVNYSNARELGYRGPQNPFPTMDFNVNMFDEFKFVGSSYAELSILPDRLKFKTMYSKNYSSIEIRNVNEPYDLGASNSRPNSILSKEFLNFTNTYFDNTLTYNDNIGYNNFTVMIGSSYRNETMQKMWGKGENFPFEMQETWYLNLTEDRFENGYGDDGARYTGLSYFGRLSYNYNNKYLLYGTMRADGTSKYQEKWGYFPTVGLGWVLSEEAFMSNVEQLDYLKLRASWGQLGNDKIDPSSGANTVNVVNAVFNEQMVTGTQSTNTFAYLSWEISEVTNIGLTSNWLNKRLNAELDFFVRKTKNAVIPVLIPIVGGSVNRDVGIIKNTGIELSLDWQEEITSDLSYSIGANFSTLKNEVVDLYGQPYIDGGMAEFRQRSMVGEPLLAFYGLEVEGVYQNDQEISNDPIAQENGLVPGDLKFKDKDGDGDIDADDRTVIGSYIPTFTYGANIGLTYRNIEFSASIIGQTGNEILNRRRGNIIWTNDVNMDADLAENRWHGEGTSTRYPSASGMRRGWNQQMSDYFVEDGTFFRIQNVRFAYNINDKTLAGISVPDIKISLVAERPLTMFSYNGFNPEIPDGIDNQTYPVPAIYTVGLSVNF